MERKTCDACNNLLMVPFSSRKRLLLLAIKNNDDWFNFYHDSKYSSESELYHYLENTDLFRAYYSYKKGKTI